MSEDSDRASQDEAMPNRGRRREPPIIEGEVTPDAAAPAAPARSRSATLALLLSTVALLGAGTSLWFALNMRDTSANEANAALAQRLDRLERRVGALEAKPAPAIPDVAPLNARLGALETKSEKSASDAARAMQLADEALRKPAPQPAQTDLSPLERRIDALEQRPLANSSSAADDARVAKLESEIDALRKSTDAQKPADGTALAILAASLRQQLERGAPFAREVAALEKQGIDANRLASLKPLAANGAPTAQKLAQEFSALSSAMLRAAHPAIESEDLLERLGRSAASLMRIRPAGDSTDENAPALISRTEAALQRNDVEGALALFDRLPAAVKDVARDWAPRARARANADAAARGLLDAAIDRMAGK